MQLNSRIFVPWDDGLYEMSYSYVGEIHDPAIPVVTLCMHVFTCLCSMHRQESFTT